jgi:adenylate kinase family enzyme
MVALRTAIVGNSGSGKSTLARKLAAASGAPILDLDTIAWEPDRIAVLRDPAEVNADLDRFCAAHESWIIEGCYGDLIEHSLAHAPELVFVHPGEQVCLRNCRARPWEPHKYASQAAQDAMLEPLLAWVSAYYTRDGTMSLARHRAMFDAYRGPKRELTAL